MILMIDDFGEVELTAGTANVALLLPAADDGESVIDVTSDIPLFLPPVPGDERGEKRRSFEGERPPLRRVSISEEIRVTSRDT